MQLNKIFRVMLVGVGVWLVAFLAAIPVRAQDPVPGGLPWNMQTPWPTARPLKPGEAFAPGALPAPTLTPTSVPPVAPAARSLAAPAIVVVPSPAPVVVAPVMAAPPALPAPASVPAPAPSVVAIKPVAPAPTGNGESPLSPLNTDGNWRALNGGASVWHRVGKGGQRMEVTLEASILNAVSLDVFAPGDYQRPIGRGTESKNTSALLWGGGHWRSSGDWLARVTNASGATIQYRLTSSASNIGDRSCFGYWEYIGTAPVYWMECNREQQ